MLGSMLERLVLKNGVECTSQRLKWTSGLAVRSGGLGGEAPQVSRAVWVAARPPMISAIGIFFLVPGLLLN